MEKVFAAPRFVGERFNNHSLPVDVVGDLAAYQAMLVDVAKHLYLQDHPERHRVPKGFSEVSLDITKIESGSTSAILTLVSVAMLSSQPLLIEDLTGQDRYYERAKELITECIAHPDSLPDHFPKEALRYFNRFGRSLRPGEELEFASDIPGKPVVLTCEKRKQLVLAADSSYEQEVEYAGYIEEVDAPKCSYRLHLGNGQKIIVTLAQDFLQRARPSIGNDRDQLVIKGIALYDSHDNFKNFVSIETAEITRNYELISIFDELSKIKNGWFDGHGKALDSDSLRTIAEIMIDEFPERLVLPSIVPTQDGNLLFEWQYENMPSVDIDLTTKIASFHAFGVNGEDIEGEFTLKDEKEISSFFNFLLKHIPGRNNE